MLKIVLQDWPGFLLIFLSFYVVIKFQKKWKDHHLTIALFFILVIHHIIALTNTYLFIIHGADADAVSFHRLGMEWAIDGKWSIGVGAGFYHQFLGIFYRIFGPSHLLGEELSVIAFLFACFVLIKIINLLNITKYRVALLLMFGLLPTNLVLCSVTMRESYQILFFMLSIYWGLRFHFEPTKRAMIFCIFSSLIMGFFHKALILYILFLIPVLFLWLPKGISRFSIKRFIVIGTIIFVIVGILFMGVLLNLRGFGALASFFSGKGLKYAADYRTRLMFRVAPDARANYGIILDKSSLGSLVKTVSFAYFYYLFAPLPWQVTNWLDIYALTESLLRFIFIIFSLIYWFRADDAQHRIWGLLLIIYFSMTFLWSTGTVNYGTSIRHHMLTNWIIIISGGPGLIEFLIQQFRRIFQTVRESV